MTLNAIAGRRTLTVRAHPAAIMRRPTPVLLGVALFAVVATATLSPTAPGSTGRFPIDRAVRELLPKEATAQPRPQSRPTGVLAAEVDALSKLVSVKYRVSRHATNELVHAAYREGARIGLDPLLILAVVGIESRFNPLAESDRGAVGLMQIVPRYHADKIDAAGGRSMLDPQTNIQVGASVLKEYITRDGSQVAGLQRYNGSPGDASNAYANKVLGERQWLQRALKGSHQNVRA